MKLSEFNTHMPEELIASHPADVRDESRLMVLHKNSNEIEHRVFKDIQGNARKACRADETR